MDEPTWEEEEESEEFIGSVNNIRGAQMNLEKVCIAQEKDKTLMEVKKRVKGSPPTKQQLTGSPENHHTFYQQLKSL